MMNHQNIKGITKNAGFTLIEMLVVMAIMATLIALTAPFVASLRSDISMQRTIRQVKVDLIATMSYSLAGKSFASLSAGDMMNPNLIPAAYSIYFESDTDYGSQKPYKYLEMTTEDGFDNAMELSYEIDHDYISPSVYLKKIVLLTQAGIEREVESAHIIVVPPFGKLLFIDDDQNFLTRLNEKDLYRSQREYNEIQLYFQYKDDENSETILTLNKNKVINTL